MSYLRPEIEEFADRMERAMRENQLETTSLGLLRGLRRQTTFQCTEQLIKAIDLDKTNEEKNLAVKELVLEANLCMMLAWRLLEGD